MNNLKYAVIILTSLLLLNSCSEDSDEQQCPQNEIVSMKINGEEMQFQVSSWGIDFDNDGTGYTLELQLTSGIFYPQQASYSITLRLPYKKIGNNILKEINYLRVQDTISTEGNFIQAELQSKIYVNKNSCISATFSGCTTIDGNEIVISDGIIKHVYYSPFEN